MLRSSGTLSGYVRTEKLENVREPSNKGPTTGDIVHVTFQPCGTKLVYLSPTQLGRIDIQHVPLNRFPQSLDWDQGVGSPLEDEPALEGHSPRDPGHSSHGRHGYLEPTLTILAVWNGKPTDDISRSDQWIPTALRCQVCRCLEPDVDREHMHWLAFSLGILGRDPMGKIDVGVGEPIRLLVASRTEPTNLLCYRTKEAFGTLCSHLAQRRVKYYSACHIIRQVRFCYKY